MNVTLVLLMVSVSNSFAFERHEIDAFTAGYQVAVADIDGDGRLDIAALSTREDQVDWYENETWKRHPIARTARNIDLAFHDVDGDGKVEMALAAGFYFDDAGRGGEIFLLKPGASADHQWQKRQIGADPVTHRVRWGDLDGSGRKELIHAPIFGPGSNGAVHPTPAHLMAFIVPKNWERSEIRSVLIDQSLTVLHGVHVADLNGDGRDEILTASFEGIHRFDLVGDLVSEGWRKTQISAGARPQLQEPGAPRGSSEVAPGKLADGTFFIAAIEPWHGHEVVMYTAAGTETGTWRRRVLDDTLDQGHVLVVADFDGDGSDEVVAGWRGGEGGLTLYHIPDAEEGFRAIPIDRGIAVEGAVAADLNLNGQLDLVALGGRTNNLVWYENRSR